MNDATALAPSGLLHVGLNHANVLLVDPQATAAAPQGIAPDIARELARRLGVELAFTRFELPGPLADAIRDGSVDLGFLAIEPERAGSIDFADAYLEIEAGYLVAGDDPARAAADVDRPGMRIAVVGRSAYDLWLGRHLRHATLVRADSFAASCALFAGGGADAVAGLTQALLGEAGRARGARLLDDAFTTVRQSIAVPPGRGAAVAALNRFVAALKASSFVADAIRRHRVGGVRAAS